MIWGDWPARKSEKLRIEKLAPSIDLIISKLDSPDFTRTAITGGTSLESGPSLLGASHQRSKEGGRAPFAALE